MSEKLLQVHKCISDQELKPEYDKKKEGKHDRERRFNYPTSNRYYLGSIQVQLSLTPNQAHNSNMLTQAQMHTIIHTYQT